MLSVVLGVVCWPHVRVRCLIVWRFPVDSIELLNTQLDHSKYYIHTSQLVLNVHPLTTYFIEGK